jgi:hypothetical protein
MNAVFFGPLSLRASAFSADVECEPTTTRLREQSAPLHPSRFRNPEYDKSTAACQPHMPVVQSCSFLPRRLYW